MAIYDVTGNSLIACHELDGSASEKAYDVQGGIVFNADVDYSDYAITDFCSVSLSPTQGFDIYDNTIFQFTSTNRMATVNAENSTIIQSGIVTSSDHGDSATFSNEFYANTDSYPLLYVTADTSPAKIYINRVTQTSSQLIKTLSFPLDKTGYYAALCFDADSNIAYMVGYSEQNYQTDDGGDNKTVISKWDMSNLTQNQDGTFTPQYVSKFERAFIYTMQGQQFHDGMLWISSGGTNVRGYVYALDPTNGNLLYTVDSGTSVEMEGIAFIAPNEMVFGLQGGTYKKVTFPIV